MSALTLEQAAADIEFLLARCECAGSCSFGSDRWTGMSSNAIVSLAYGGKQDAMPRDRSDYAACVRTVRRLPLHRRTPEVMQALRLARAAYLENYPTDRFPAARKAQREEWERQSAESRKHRRRRTA